MSERYCLIQDNSGHWYICPATKVDEAKKQFEKIEEYWREADYDKDVPEEPNYIESIGSPSRLTFENPEIM